MRQSTAQAWICITCGTQFPPSLQEPPLCPICEDERQYVEFDGQQWTTLERIRADHQNRFIDLEPGVTAILTEPNFAIGQRAFLIDAPAGNVLWDCVALLDDATIAAVRKRGGVHSIAISHPHYYTTMLEWAEAFDATIYLHAADRRWVMRPDSRRIHLWETETLALHDNMTLIRAGGHFPGGAVLHHAAAASGRGALFSGDIIQVVPDRRWVSFMYSYPNLIPLSERQVCDIVRAVDFYRFDRIYGAFHPRQIMSDAQQVVRRSAVRYIEHLTGVSDGLPIST